MSPFDLTGRTALITGASRGIGFAIARGLGEAGASVVINARSAGPLKEAAERLRGLGITVREAAFDVADEAAVKRAAGEIENAGAIDILVNNAGMQVRAPLVDYEYETWRRLMATNVDSLFLVSRAFAPGMIARGRGKIINIASVTSRVARPNVVPYTASKGAVALLTQGMCAEWASKNIQVNDIAPGYIKTELNQELLADEAFTAWVEKRTPAARWGETEELAGAAVFLASDASAYVNGHVLYVDGGMTAVM